MALWEAVVGDVASFTQIVVTVGGIATYLGARRLPRVKTEYRQLSKLVGDVKEVDGFATNRALKKRLAEYEMLDRYETIMAEAERAMEAYDGSTTLGVMWNAWSMESRIINAAHDARKLHGELIGLHTSIMAVPRAKPGIQAGGADAAPVELHLPRTEQEVRVDVDIGPSRRLGTHSSCQQEDPVGTSTPAANAKKSHEE